VEHAAGVTDAAGEVLFMLTGSADGVTYQVRLYKTGAITTNPYTISVLESAVPATPNEFDATVDVMDESAATDPYMCRVTGYIKSSSGRPVAGANVNFDPLHITVAANELGATSASTVTDTDGAFTIDLYRGVTYMADCGSVDAMETIVIPDRAWIRFTDLMYPRVMSAIPVDASISPTVGVATAVAVTTVLSDFSDTITLVSWLTATSSDEAVAAVVMSADGVLVTGAASGTCTITLERIIPSGLEVKGDTTDIRTITVTVA